MILHYHRLVKTVFCVLCSLFAGAFAVFISAQERAIVRVENINNAGVQLQALGNWAIQKELHLTHEQVQQIKSVPFAAAKAVPHNHPDLVGLPNDRRIIRRTQLVSEFNESILDEVLLPEQRKRLENLMYYREIALIGIDASIEFGSLGRESGVTDQGRNLAENARSELRDSSKTESNMRQRAYDKILAELTSEQRHKCIDLLGSSFEYSDYKVLHNQQLLNQQELFGIDIALNMFDAPDFAKSANLLEIISVGCVVDELQITKSQLRGCMKLRNETEELFRSARLKSVEMPKEERIIYLRSLPKIIENRAEVGVSEILLPAQLERLRQLVNHVEIAYVGFDVAITVGNLAGKIGITENQVTSLQQKVRQFTADMKNDIRHLKESTQNRILSHFPNPQREKARTLLGDFFVYEDYALLLTRQLKREKDALSSEENGSSTPKSKK